MVDFPPVDNGLLPPSEYITSPSLVADDVLDHNVRTRSPRPRPPAPVHGCAQNDRLADHHWQRRQRRGHARSGDDPADHHPCCEEVRRVAAERGSGGGSTG